MVYTKIIKIHSVNQLRNALPYASKKEKTGRVDESLKSHFDEVLPYIMDSDKTLHRRLVTAHRLTNVEQATEEMLLTKLQAAYAKGTNIQFDCETGEMKAPELSSLDKGNKKGKPILAYHLIQSFSPEDDLTPEEVHEMGRQTALEFTGGECEFVIATHTDKEHTHNHIVVNSTKQISGKALHWKTPPKKLLEQISDKICSQAGAKIIEKSPKNNHARYTMWQVEGIYKKKVQSRLDFLLDHSSNLEDFLLKAQALNLEMDFSGKWATYKLLDEPQMRATRGRNLLKSDPEKYNLIRIEEKLEMNGLELSVEEILARYEEKIEARQSNFDFQMMIEPWQIHHATEKGYYLNVDFGTANHGQVFIGAYKVDKLEDGNYNLFIKQDDYFQFLNAQSSERSRYMSGANLVKQLRLYNGHVPLKKDRKIETIDEIVDAINFMLRHDVQNGVQLENLEENLQKEIDESIEKVKALDEQISDLKQIAKYKLGESLPDEHLQEIASQRLKESEIDDESGYIEIMEEVEAIQFNRDVLDERMTEAIHSLDRVHEIQYNAVNNQESKNSK